MKRWSEPCPKELVGDKGIIFLGCFNQCVFRLLLGISTYLSFLISSFLVHVFPVTFMLSCNHDNLAGIHL